MPAVAGALERVYVPNRSANSVSVYRSGNTQGRRHLRGRHPSQHVVPSWDLKILWVANNAEGRTDGSMTPIDPKTGKPGASIPVDDPYNVYWTPDGRHTVVVAEAFKRLDFRDAKTMKLDHSIETPACPRGSTTPISPSTAATPCSPASSAAPSPRSWARTGCTPAATARACTSPTAAATRFAADPEARAASRPSISRRGR